jgi:hypothetical protein
MYRPTISNDEGLAQLDGYLSGLGLETGWLVIFDRRGASRLYIPRWLGYTCR